MVRLCINFFKFGHGLFFCLDTPNSGGLYETVLFTDQGRGFRLSRLKKTAFQVFLEQFKDLMVIILIIAAVISAFTGDLESTLVIIAVLILKRNFRNGAAR